MTNISFKHWQVNDHEPAFTQESSLRRLLAFAGLHDVSAKTLIPGAAYDWGSTQGTWTDGEGTGGGSSQWYKQLLDTEVSLGFVAEFDKTGDRGGFVFGATAASWNSYLVWWTSTRCGFSKLTGTGGYTETKLIDLPNAQTGTAHVTVAVKPIASTSIDRVDDLAISLWFDGRLLFSYTMAHDTAIGPLVGLAVYASDSVTYTNLTVPQFHQLVDMTYIGPTEQAAGGVSRILGMDKIRLQARFNGSVRIWRNDEVTADWSYDASDLASYTVKEDLYAPTHYQLVGGLYQADVVAGASLTAGTEQHRGHIFVQGNDPNVATEMETFARAERKGFEALEQANSVDFVLPFNPLMEAEDVISVTLPFATAVLYRVTSIDFNAVWAERGVRYETRVSCRRLINAF